ncbi:MAG: heterocyst frequency control protein PatD [Scytonematopsis contorta HA4267-MV1]|jgi:hypothetical protein|nr:heterocyst frequency control protein PatD [Scytonematopsis contorta HA4267-MV1]
MSLDREKYQKFASLLQGLHSDVTEEKLDAITLRGRIVELQQFFGQQIVPDAENDISTQSDSREQSYRTEMSKQLRLLEIDVMFLQGARQVSTAQTRVNTIKERLTTLIRYCEAVL